jgi:peptidyl-prolyl cis-trans isomerase B (cyclophilin B)
MMISLTNQLLFNFLGEAMNKGVFSIITAVIFFSLLYCSTALNTEGKMEKSSVGPKYIISVTHKGNLVGTITLELFPDIAPKHCANFDSLVSIGFYNGTAFHRVIPGFMIQGGDPNSRDKAKSTWGVGDPSQTKVPAEFSDITHARGILSTARRGDDINSATSQFFIMVKDSPFLDGQYTVFGKVIEGMDIADYIVNVPRDSRDNPNDKVEMTIKKAE